MKRRRDNLALPLLRSPNSWRELNATNWQAALACRPRPSLRQTDCGLEHLLSFISYSQFAIHNFSAISISSSVSNRRRRRQRQLHFQFQFQFLAQLQLQFQFRFAPGSASCLAQRAGREDGGWRVADRAQGACVCRIGRPFGAGSRLFPRARGRPAGSHTRPASAKEEASGRSGRLRPAGCARLRTQTGTRPQQDVTGRRRRRFWFCGRAGRRMFARPACQFN